MDCDILFTDAIKCYDIQRIRSLLEKYDNNVRYLIIEWWDLKYDEQGTRQIENILKGAIYRLNVEDVKLYFELLVPKNLYINDKVIVREIKHDYQMYYEYAMINKRYDVGEYLKSFL